MGSPKGVRILLSHTPWHIEKALKQRVRLMLSGHTYGGQIWPFDYITRRFYPFLEGKFSIGEMTLIVNRGTGTWGPHMRLWARGEISQVKIRRK